MSDKDKAAPVGKREVFGAYCQSIGYTLKTGDSGRYLGGYGAELWAGFKAGAAYQRAQQPQSVDGEDWGVFASYLLDKCEGETIYEENLQHWLSCMVADPHYGPLFRREGQQPQSAEAVNRAHVMDALLMWNRRHEIPPIKIGYEYGVAGAVLDLVATPQPSAGVVVPDALNLLTWLRGAINCNAENDTGRHGVWFSTKHPMIQRIDSMLARLNGKEVGRE